MKKVPKMISTKDASYIKDIFNWNIVAYKKINYYLDSITDKNISSLLEDIARTHYSFCEKLISLLESGDTND